MTRHRLPVVFSFVLVVCLTSLGQSDFSVVLLPDTQFYSQSYPNIFMSQTQWIVDNAASRNIVMVIGEGDIVNHDYDATQWSNAETAADILNGKVPYTFAIGNHDYDNYQPSARGTTAFNAHFGPQRYASYSWYGGNYNGGNENFYTFFNGGGVEYMVLALEFFPRNAVLQWADSVLSSYPNKKVIVVTHSFENTDGFRVDTCDTNDISPSSGNNAEIVWNKLLRHHSNVQFVVSGHLIGTGTAHRTDLGDNGNLVHQIFTNFQSWTNGGNGYLRILTFHAASNTVDVTTYSPYLNQSLTTSDQQFTLPLQYSSTGNAAYSGKVRSTTCTKIGGATVSTAGFVATTDSNGKYTLSGVPAPGALELQAAAAGYDSGSLSDSDNPGLTTQMNFYLSPTPSSTCTLNTTDPSVTICTPAPNATVPSPVHIVAQTTSSNPVSYVQVYVDGALKDTVNAASIDKSYALTAGAHRLTVQAKNSASATFKSTINITVTSSTTQGNVSINSPVNGSTVGSPFTVSATATPASGQTISSTSVLLDGTSVYTTASPNVNTSVNAANGTHTVTVQSTDSAGTVIKSSVSVTVSTTTSAGSVTITSPTNGATVTSPFTVSATATPATGQTVSSTSVLLDGTSVYTTSSGTVNTSITAAGGTHTITVQSTDSAGTVTMSSVPITVSTSTGTGTVTIGSPTNGATVTSPFTVSAVATPVTGRTITRSTIYLDGANVYSIASATVNTTISAAAGTHKLTVQSTDNTGALIKSSISITVGSGTTSSTSITINAPADGSTVSSTFTLSATVSLATGRTLAWTAVYLDGVKKFGGTSTSVSTTLTTTSGTHKLTVQAKDSAAVVTNKTIYVTVP